jgi:ABC-2 type transport system permease protein
MRWIGLKTLVLRECGVIVRFWSVTLAPPVIMAVLYFTIFGKIIGTRIGLSGGLDYIRFMTPGLILLWVIPFSYGHTATALLGARIYRFIEELLVAPLPAWKIMTGYVIGGTLRGLLVGTAIILTSLLFTHLEVQSVWTSIAAILLAAVVSALGGFITALLVKNFEQVATVQISILVPLTYSGGVFTALSDLPGWARKFSLVNPVFYAVNAFRYGVVGVSDVPPGIALAVLSGFGVLLLLVALVLMSRGAGMRELTLFEDD